MTDTLKPCPFCGQRVYWREYDGELECIGCEVIFTSDVVGLAGQFNRRSPDARLEAERAVIEAAKDVDKSLGVNRTSADIALHDALAHLSATEGK